MSHTPYLFAGGFLLCLDFIQKETARAKAPHPAPSSSSHPPPLSPPTSSLSWPLIAVTIALAFSSGLSSPGTLARSSHLHVCGSHVRDRPPSNFQRSLVSFTT